MDFPTESCFIGETEFSIKINQESLKINFTDPKRRWLVQVLSASHSTNSRGVTTLLNKSIPLQIEGVTEDPNGTFLTIQGRILSAQINLIIYMDQITMMLISITIYF